MVELEKVALLLYHNRNEGLTDYRGPGNLIPDERDTRG